MATVDPTALRLAWRSAHGMYRDDQASQGLGITLVDVAPGRAVARMTVTDAMVNGHAVAHGGYLFLLADSAFAFACNTYGVVTVAHTAEVTFVRPAFAGDELVATAEERLRYGKNGVYDVTVRRADGTVLAEFRGHCRAFPDRPIALAGAETNQPDS